MKQPFISWWTAESICAIQNYTQHLNSILKSIYFPTHTVVQGSSACTINRSGKINFLNSAVSIKFSANRKNKSPENY